ncbi:hypothetical protein ABZY09_30685 [Streptomyces sp. NPDC002928]|uniref:hypothetical protein n=1 Tax=Streptomyces sp. NPDC002928 TaxID=3154440 RepID=UPI00339F3C83
MENETGHSILCAWPYRSCVEFCAYLKDWESHKFSAPLAERLWTLSLDTNQDAELGDADTFGWFARFDHALAMLSADSQGFVGVSVFESVTDLNTAWEALEREHVWSIVNELSTSDCDELFLIVDTARHLGLAPDMGTVADHIHHHAECFDRNAWILEA